MKRKLLFFFLIILCFRLVFSAQNIYFRQDAARDLGIIQDLISQGVVFVGYGPKASVGDFYLPPFYFQLHLVVSYLTNNHPLAMQFLTTVLDSFTPILVFLIIRLLLGEKSAWIGALVYSFMFQVIKQGSMPWNPNLVPLITSLTLWCALVYYKKKLPQLLIPLVLGLTIAIHLHYQATVVLPFYMTLFVWSLVNRPKDIKWWIFGGFFGLAITLPYFFTESNNNWVNTQAIIQYFSGEHSRYFDRISKLSFIWTFLPSFFERTALDFSYLSPWFGRIILFWGGFLIFSQAFVKKSKLSKWLVWYFVVILVMLRVYKGDKLDYYMSTLYIFPAIGVGYMYQKHRLSGLILTLFIIFYSTNSILRLPKVNELSELEQASSTINKHFSNSDFRLIFYDHVYVNTFGYAFSKYQLPNLNDESLNVVEIMDKRQQLPGTYFPSCRKTGNANFSDQLYRTGGFQLIDVYESSRDFKVVIGKLRCQPTISAKSPVEYRKMYGGIQFFK